MDRNTDWNAQNRQTVLQGKAILERTGDSIARSEQIAIETETIGTEVLSELDGQRETLLRAKNRLTSGDEQLASSRRILRQISRGVLYNKLILIVIIILEVVIAGAITYVRFIK
ncbi:hypothetical protein PPYR_02477 [Photinus pyralis]|uniref:t-SNARE coiled-coil homology domain-containing protein n=1 Tax=Photinus pyralis TaxID=7054 RepID=A0A1Y1MVK3_PHOPY|nr:hypothetical protein PPYR_02477 [Photinus pyralis]